MAARRRRAPGWTGAERDPQLDGLFGGMRDFVQERTGLTCSIGSEAETLLVGLPLPALCLQYVFQSTVFPLSRVVQITGEEGSAKSALLYEIMRWHMTYGGGGILAQNELKDSPDLRASLLKYNQLWLSRCDIIDTHSMEEWQKVWTFGTQFMREKMDAPGGPGRTVPVLVGTDSITATAPQDEIDQMMKEGCARRGFALLANLISRYMRTIPKQIENYPFTYVGTNHLKPSTDYMGRPTANIPGGKSVKFYETYEIEMHKHHQADIDTLNYGGLRVVIKTRKNSLGPSRKQFMAELLWWMGSDPETGEPRQETAWDWDAATINLLLRFETDKGKKTLYKTLRDICDINVVSKQDGGVCWSRALGIPQSEPLPFRAAGAMLEQRQDLKDAMYPHLGIIKRYPFQPGVDYRVSMAAARENAEAESRNLYTNPVALPQLADSVVGDDVPVESQVEETLDETTEVPEGEPAAVGG